MNIEKRFDRITEWLDHKVSQWYAFPVFGLTVALVWAALGYDYANFWISVVTVAFFFLFNYGQRKDRIVNQRKHNEEILAIQGARDETTGLDTKTLSELEAEDKASG